MNEDKDFFDIPFEEFLKLRGNSNLTTRTEASRYEENSFEDSLVHAVMLTEDPPPEDGTFECVSLSEIKLDHSVQSDNKGCSKSSECNSLDANDELEALLAALDPSADGSLLTDHQFNDWNHSANLIPGPKPQQNDLPEEERLVEEKRRLQKEVNAAQKRLADHERRIVELRRVHRQTYKKVIKAEDHVRRLIEKERQRNDAARKQSEEQQSLLNELRSLSAQAEEKLAALLQETLLEQVRIEELERATAAQQTSSSVSESNVLMNPRQLGAQHSLSDADRSAALIERSAKAETTAFFELIAEAFEDPSLRVRNVALQLLLDRESDRVSSLTRILRCSLPDRRRKIGRTMIESGLVDESIQDLAGNDPGKVSEANSILFLLCKSGELQPLIAAVEQHPSNFVRLTAVKLMASSEGGDVVPTLRRFAVRTSIPEEIRAAARTALQNVRSVSSVSAS